MRKALLLALIAVAPACFAARDVWHAAHGGRDRCLEY